MPASTRTTRESCFTVTLGSAIAAFIMRSRIKRINGRNIMTSFAKIALASAAMSAACYFSLQYLESQFPTRTFSVKFIEAFGPIAIGGLIFVGMAKLLGVTEIEKLYSIFKRKLGRAN